MTTEIQNPLPTSDPNLYATKFEPYWGCPCCATSWEQEGSIKMYGHADIEAVGMLSDAGGFIALEAPEITDQMHADQGESHFCYACEACWDGPEYYEDPLIMLERIKATPDVERS